MESENGAVDVDIADLDEALELKEYVEHDAVEERLKSD